MLVAIELSALRSMEEELKRLRTMPRSPLSAELVDALRVFKEFSTGECHEWLKTYCMADERIRVEWVIGTSIVVKSIDALKSYAARSL